MEQKAPSTIFASFEAASRKYSSNPAIYFKKDQNFTSLTYQELYYQVLYFANFLLGNKIKPCDKVAIILDNGPHWPIAFLGVMAIGAVAVPLYPHLEHSELRQLVLHSESKLILTSTNTKSRIQEAIKESSIPIITLDSPEILPKTISIPQENPVNKNISGYDLACIVYTSGTTSTPKGVMLSHKNLLANFAALTRLNIITSRDTIICLLPLYHSYPLMVNLLFVLLSGAKISFPLNLDAEEITACLKNTQVTILVGVPRLFAMLAEKINKNIASLSFFKRFLIAALLDFTTPVRTGLKINLSRLVMRDLHHKFGPQLRLMVSGGAKLSKVVAKDFFRWGFTILEGYGLTESSPVITYNRPHDFKLGSVGKPLDGIEIKINEPDESGIGEILARGQNITAGYYKAPELSQDTLKDGWLFTRDLGYIDKKGFLFIAGRKNETLVLSSGKKINPEDLEAYYSKSPYIDEICVFLPEGEGARDLLTAVILSNYQYLREQKIAQVKDRIRYEIEKMSRGLPPYKRIQKYIIINERLPRTILGKLKRFEIAKKYPADFESSGAGAATAEISPEDALLVSSVLSQNALVYISQRVKRPVNLDEHLELDLGLDSLERITLFFEFQKISGVDIDEKLFFSVSTVRDVLNKLKSASVSKTITAPDWKVTLNSELEPELKQTVRLQLGFWQKLANLLLNLILVSITRLFFRLQVKGKENVPSRGPVIFCPNHTSYLDPPLVAVSLSLPALFNTYFLGFGVFLDSVFLRWAKKLLRLVSVDVSSRLIDALKVCSHILKNSKMLCMFPEGGRSPDGQIREFKRGIGILIKELDVPVIPVYIKGTYASWPVGRILPRFKKITVIFGKKLTLQDLTREQRESIDVYQNIAYTLRVELERLQQASTK